MKRISALALVIFTLSAGLPAWADDDLLSKEFATCVEAAGGVTSDTLNCIYREDEKQDVKLNAAYKQLMAKLPTYRQEALRKAQRAWIVYRDAYRDYFRDREGGTLALVVAATWAMHCTAERTLVLERERDWVLKD